METKSAGEHSILIVIFILQVFNTGDLYKMQTHLFFVIHLIKNILHQPADTPSPQEKLKQTRT